MATRTPIPYRQFLGHRARSAAASTWTDENGSAPTSTAGAPLSAPTEPVPGEPTAD